MIKKCKVLLVEDHETLRELMTQLLMMNNNVASVITAENGKAALQILKKKKFDLVITDVSMPEVDGMQLISRLKADGNDVRILVSSMKTDYSTVSTLFSHGVQGIIKKDSSIEVIHDAVDQINEGGTYFDEGYTFLTRFQ